jgi:hypothetical protein
MMEKMGRLEFTTPREAWGGEATDFTPALGTREMLEYLGRETGIGPMTPVGTEVPTAGGRSLDILAETSDGRRVAIENQYSRSDHDHLTRGLAYAVATESRVLVVIAEDHRDEFISVADYLNAAAATAGDQGIKVWLVKVRAVRRIGDTQWSPEFVVQAEPNEWEATIRASHPPTMKSLEEFYDKCTNQTDQEWAETAKTIIEAWASRDGGRETHGSASTVALYYRDPIKGDQGTNVLQVWVNGDIVVCRGYIRDSAGVFSEKELGDLDEQIRRWFPDAIWPAKQYYLTQHGADPEALAGFGDWLAQRFDEAIETRE